MPGRMGVCVRVYACSLAYPACNLYALYCDVIFGPSDSNTSVDVIPYTAGFSEKIIEHKMNISHSKNNLAKYCHKYENVFMLSARYSYRILTKLEFSRRFFEKKKA
jgi:hypothetical protein